MKIVTTILFLISSVVKLNAQKIHFTDTSNVWCEASSYFDFDNLTQTPFVYSYYSYISDTTIDTTVYRWFDIENEYCCGFFLREDTTLNKVYMRDVSADSDIVLMDNNLQTGDTFTITYRTNVFKYLVEGVDSTLINATWHKVWTFSNNLTPDHGPLQGTHIIEGIGSITHPMYLIRGYQEVEIPTEIMYCFANNGTNPLVTPAIGAFDNDTSCLYPPTLSVRDPNSFVHKISLYPIPATSVLTISSDDYINSLVVTNITGQIVDEYSLKSKYWTIDVSGFSPGIYFIKINGTTIRKFIKE